MPCILQIDFPYTGPWESEMYESFKYLAESILNETGLIWKIWTENKIAAEAGGIYLFESQTDAQAYLKMHIKRLEENGLNHLRHRIFDINTKLSEICSAPI